MPEPGRARLFGVNGLTTSSGHGRATGIAARLEPRMSASRRLRIPGTGRPGRLRQRRVADTLVPGVRVEPAWLAILGLAKTVHLLAPITPPYYGGSSG